MNITEGHALIINQLEALSAEANSSQDSDGAQFYQEIKHAIKRRDSKLPSYVDEDVELLLGKGALEFLLELSNLVEACSNLDYSQRLHLGHDNMGSEDEEFLKAIAIALNQVIEDVEDTMLPLHYFQQAFAFVEETVLITDVKGIIKSGSNLSLLGFELEELTFLNIDHFISDFHNRIDESGKRFDIDNLDKVVPTDLNGNRLRHYKCQAKMLSDPNSKNAGKFIVFRFVPRGKI